MLVKQQDRLEEREQDIEQQLYKLESDKRLVEVTGIIYFTFYFPGASRAKLQPRAAATLQGLLSDKFPDRTSWREEGCSQKSKKLTWAMVGPG